MIQILFFCLFVSQVVHSSYFFCLQDVSTWIQTGFWTSSWRCIRVGLTRMSSFCLSSSPTCVSHSPSATSSALNLNSTRWEKDSRTESLNIFDFTLTNTSLSVSIQWPVYSCVEFVFIQKKLFCFFVCFSVGTQWGNSQVTLSHCCCFASP